VGPHTPEVAVRRLLPTIRYDVRFESDRLRDLGVVAHHRMAQGASPEENALQLAAFLDIPSSQAQEIAATDYLFVD
ncbi:MAG: glycosyl transferase, partial [Tabrizicola sp.]|nr:glycosyl transferase [Tabrizicola sp.]